MLPDTGTGDRSTRGVTILIHGSPAPQLPAHAEMRDSGEKQPYDRPTQESRQQRHKPVIEASDPDRNLSRHGGKEAEHREEPRDGTRESRRPVHARPPKG